MSVEDLKIAAIELRSEIGVVHHQSIQNIDLLWARRFALATGETDLIYFDEKLACSIGWRGMPISPLMLSSTRSWEHGPTNENLALDGTPLYGVGFPSQRSLRSLGGGQKLKWVDDVVVGDEISTTSKVVDVIEKSGSRGDMLLVEVERCFYGVDGKIKLTCSEQRILR